MLALSSAKLPPPEKIGRWTTDEYFKMIEMGIIRNGAPYELLDGLLVLKDRSTRGEDIMSIGSPHNICVGLITDLTPQFPVHGCHMQIQGPLVIAPSHAPEPDGAIIRGKRRDYSPLPPPASAASCAIEVADSSLQTDRDDKGSKYAEAGIPQYVIMNLINRVIEIYERPDHGQRKYLDCRIVKPGGNVDFLLADGTRLIVPASELLP